MQKKSNIRRLDVETPFGVVHLAAFPKIQGTVSHRDVIYEILSDYTGQEVSAGILTRSRGLLDEPSSVGERPTFPSLDFDVNWTHSGKECVVAFGERGSLVDGTGLHIGVDMEVHNAKRLRVADRFYSPEERDALKAAPADASGEVSVDCPQVREFFRLWCRKEAFYKCVGGSFFEGAVGRNMLPNPVDACDLQVHFIDLEWVGPASLALALCKTV